MRSKSQVPEGGLILVFAVIQRTTQNWIMARLSSARGKKLLTSDSLKGQPYKDIAGPYKVLWACV